MCFLTHHLWISLTYLNTLLIHTLLSFSIVMFTWFEFSELLLWFVSRELNKGFIVLWIFNSFNCFERVFVSARQVLVRRSYSSPLFFKSLASFVNNSEVFSRCSLILLTTFVLYFTAPVRHCSASSKTLFPPCSEFDPVEFIILIRKGGKNNVWSLKNTYVYNLCTQIRVMDPYSELWIIIYIKYSLLFSLLFLYFINILFKTGV